MTAVVEQPSDDVVLAAAEDLDAAVAHALERAGCTVDELLAQARSGRFTSIRARLAWVAVGDLLRGEGLRPSST